jgi:hypothetical protein
VANHTAKRRPLPRKLYPVLHFTPPAVGVVLNTGAGLACGGGFAL